MKVLIDVPDKLFGNVLEEVDDNLIRQVVQANICFGDTIKLTKIPKGYKRQTDKDNVLWAMYQADDYAFLLVKPTIENEDAND